MQFDSIVVDPQRTAGEQAAALERQGYAVIGSHSGVKLCRPPPRRQRP